MSLCSTGKTFTIYSKLDLCGKSFDIFICMHLHLILYAVPVTLLFRYLAFWDAMDYQKQSHFILGKTGIYKIPWTFCICAAMHVKGLYGTILGSLLHLSEGMVLPQKNANSLCHAIHLHPVERILVNVLEIHCLLKILCHWNKYFQVGHKGWF